MAVPKRKTSKARRNSRRSSVWKLDAPTLMKCPNCGELLEFDFSGLFDGEDIKELEECDGECDGCDGCEGEETE